MNRWYKPNASTGVAVFLVLLVSMFLVPLFVSAESDVRLTLEDRVALLETKVVQLEKHHFSQEWGEIKHGLTRDEVKSFVGSPKSRTGGLTTEIWHYSGLGHVVFDVKSRKVIEWIPPIEVEP